MPSFTWPGAQFNIWIENVFDTSQSRVKLVNTTAECESTQYDQAVPVIQNIEDAEKEQPIEAYLVADVTKRIVCFFELPTSLALIVQTEAGTELEFSKPAAPSTSLIISGVVNEYVHRGLAISLLLGDVDPGEDAEVFTLPEREYVNNDDSCLPAVGIGGAEDEAALQSTADYIKEKATIGIKKVSVLPSPAGGKTHFASFNEQDTLLLEIGKSYMVCYVGSSKDSTRIFNPVGKKLKVRDVITAIYRADGEGEDPTNSQQTRLFVEASLTGDVSCMAITRKLTKAPIMAEVKGDYKEDPSLPEEYKPEFLETEVLGRLLVVPADKANSNTTVVITHTGDNVKNIKQQPMGVPPESYTWCFHSRSKGLIFPNNGEGVPIRYTVFPPPNFKYATADGKEFPEPDGIVLAQNVSFPPLLPQWETAPGFPQYYYDKVSFSIDPPLPDGILMQDADPGPDDPKIGQISPDESKEGKVGAAQISVKTLHTIKSQSAYDVQGSKQVKLSLSVHSPGLCALQSAKSTEAVVACTVQDAHNLQINAMYLLIKDASAADVQVSARPEEFFCHPRPEPSPADLPTGNSGLKFTCKKEAPLCCCWLFLAKEDPVKMTPRVITGKVLKSECGLEQFGRYETITMATGKNPLMNNADVAVANDAMFDFTMPVKPEPKPIQFEMKVDINYEAECSPEAGPEKPQQCKDMMQGELTALTGAPAEMIVVKDLRPA